MLVEEKRIRFEIFCKVLQFVDGSVLTGRGEGSQLHKMVLGERLDRVEICHITRLREREFNHYEPFDAIVVCCTFCTLLVLNVVWPLIQGLQICKLRSSGYVASYAPLEASKFISYLLNMLPATLPDIESEILCCKNILLPK